MRRLRGWLVRARWWALRWVGVERESVMVVGPMVVVAKVVVVIVVEVMGSQLAVVKWWFREGVWRFGRQGAMVLRGV